MAIILKTLRNRIELEEEAVIGLARRTVGFLGADVLLLKERWEEGLLEDHLASIIQMPEKALAEILSQHRLDRRRLDRFEKEALRSREVIAYTKTPRNFLPRKTVKTIVELSGSEIGARLIEVIWPLSKVRRKPARRMLKYA